MCGIAAILAPSGVPAGLIRSMCQAVRHRGPDDEGYALFATPAAAPRLLGGPDTPAACYQAALPYAPARGVGEGAAVLALGHRRLSILDVSPAGHQPMSYDGGRLWIAYNGEVYNYLELRAELEALGHAFATHTDTEVILAAYRQWGKACLSRFNGMFALALYDRAARTLFLARDRFGVKPLYYWASPAGFVAFASEIKEFAGLPGWRPRPNGQRTYDFLNWRVTDHTRETMFEGVFQLRGGECMELEVGAPAPPAGAPLPAQRWYELHPAPFEGSFADASERFRELLVDSVRLRLRADVPVGTCLSGGLDSSSIVCAMDALLAERGGGVQKTFSACAHEARYDERAFIDEVVRATRVEPHYVYPALDPLFDELPALAWHQDEPFGSTSIYAQWNVFRLAAQNGVTVMLDGQGADEQLAGYHVYFAPLFAGLFRSLRWGALAREVGAARAAHGYGALHAARQVAAMLLPAPLRALGRRVGARTQLTPGWLSLEALGAEPVDPFAERGAATASLRELSRTQLTSTNLQMLLHWEDRDSMAHSIESRVPFLDYRLVEFVLGLPDEHKLSGGVTKRVLRESMKGLLPERVRTRMDKMGFVTPEETWVRREAPERFRAAVRHAVEVSRGVILPSAAEKLDRMIDGSEPFEFFPWRLVSFAAWMEAFGVGAPPAAATREAA
ncbi:MAG TPA: asparagine synthase (glutamine-hydrolyzing) [Longimicrobium sp.]